MIEHPLKPIYNNDSKILILGTMPSVKSRELNFYYAHPQNRFWIVLEKVFNESIINKVEFLLKNNIALRDVIASCEINGSSDNSIKNVIPNNIKCLIEKTNIKYIFTTRKTAYNLYNKYLLDTTNIEPISLPSSSPANAKFSIDDLVMAYSVIKEKLKEE